MMKTAVGYLSAEGLNTKELDQKVTQMLRDGWQPFGLQYAVDLTMVGGPQMARNNVIIYLMVRYGSD